MSREQVILKPLESRVFNAIVESLKKIEPSTSDVSISILCKRLKITEGLVTDAVLQLANQHNLIDVEIDDDEIDNLSLIFLNDKRIKKVDIVGEEIVKTQSEIKKKLQKYTTSQLQIKHSTLKGDEKKICGEIIETRGEKVRKVYIDPELQISEKDAIKLEKKLMPDKKEITPKVEKTETVVVKKVKDVSEFIKILNDEQKSIINLEITKAERIRKLYDTSLTVAEISRFTGWNYTNCYDCIKVYRKKLEINEIK